MWGKNQKTLKKETGLENLCLAGGVALNCVANGKLLKENIFNNIWIQPASGDAGSALGAALIGWYENSNKPRIIDQNDSMKGTFLGCEFSNEEIKTYLREIHANFEELADEVSISGLQDQLESSGGNYKKNGVNTLVMDGIITQRLIELVPKAGIKVIVAEKKGPLPRDPVGITMFTREDLA